MNRTSNNEIQLEFSIQGSRMGLFNIDWHLPYFPNIGDKIEFLDEFLSVADKFNIYQLYTASDEYSYLEGAKNVEDEKVAVFYNYLCPFQVKFVGWRKDKFGIYPCLVLESYTSKRE